MSAQYLEIRELAAWDFDHPIDRGLFGEEQLRSAASHAHRQVATRPHYLAESAIAVDETEELAGTLAARKDSVELSGEFDGLRWKLSVVDLRKLIAFQRRIGFTHPDSSTFDREIAWPQLLDITIPLHAVARSPFMEVASYRGRWFLRDGYHRSFRLLKQRVFLVPCVVIHAESIAQLGAVGSRFFSQGVLFSQHPPMVTDFLANEVTVRYCRALPRQGMAFSMQQLQEVL